MCNTCTNPVEAAAVEEKTAKRAAEAEAEVNRVELSIKMLEQTQDGNPDSSLNRAVLNEKRAELKKAQKASDEAANAHTDALREKEKTEVSLAAAATLGDNTASAKLPKAAVRTSRP